MLSVSILEMYATQFESLVNFPKRAQKAKPAPKAEAIKNTESASEPEKPQINYFAGPHSVFNPLIK